MTAAVHHVPTFLRGSVDTLSAGDLSRWDTVRCAVTKSFDWQPSSPPADMESYRGLLYRLSSQKAELPAHMDPFSEPVRFVLPS